MSGGGGGGSTQVKETPAEREQAKLAVKQYNRQQQAFVPVENYLIGATQHMDAPAVRAQAEGHAAAASEQQFADARGKLEDNLFAAGYAPGSPGFAAHMGGLRTQQALATGMNAADSAQQLSDQKTAGLQGLTALGRGDTTAAFSTAGSAAGNAQSQAISDAHNALNQSLATQGLIGTGLGAAAAYGAHQFAPQAKTTQTTQTTPYRSGLDTSAYHDNLSFGGT